MNELSHPYVLVDEPDGPEEVGWVEATVTRDEAREKIAELIEPYGYEFEAVVDSKQWMRCKNPDEEDFEHQSWEPCPPDAPGATEFWRVELHDREDT